MKNLFLIVKTHIVTTLNPAQIFYKNGAKKPGRTVLFGVLGSLLLIYCLAGAGIYVFAAAGVLAGAGLLSLLPVAVFVAGTMIVFFTALLRAVPSVFSGRDTEMLLSMPVKLRQIVAGKMISLLLFEYAFLLFLFLPTAISMGWFGNPHLSFYFCWLLIFLVTPFLPTAAASLFGLLIGLFAAKTKRPSVFSSLLTIITLFCFIVLFPKTESFFSVIIESAVSTDEILLTIFPPLLLVARAANGEFLSLMLLIASYAAVFAVFVALISVFFKKIWTSLNSTSLSGRWKQNHIKKSSAFSALLFKEFRGLFSRPLYLFNACFGVIVIVLFCGWIMASGNSNHIFESLEFEIEPAHLSSALILIIMFCAGIACTTSVSVSLEGKNLWILKSAPIETKNVFLAKAAVNFFMIEPAVILAAFVLPAVHPMPFYMILFLFLMPTILAAAVSVMGLFVNLLFPKLDFLNENAVIKQSASVLVTMLLSIVIISLPPAVYLLGLSTILPLSVFGILMTIFLIAVFCVFLAMLMTRGEKLWKKL